MHYNCSYLTTTDGKNTLIAAMEKIDGTNIFDFNISGNAATSIVVDQRINRALRQKIKILILSM